ncbi:hypothetical protein [Longimicrobium sp.]|uniref:hypothetical protein n=1 Tax=Longimicrobium sp. TaxID=2029185 RepID=UPI003B3BC55A
MKKLHLELAELKVESFEITEVSAGRGTVQGHYSPRCGTGITCDKQVNTCADVETCGAWDTCASPSCYSGCPLLCGE